MENSMVETFYVFQGLVDMGLVDMGLVDMGLVDMASGNTRSRIN